MLVVVTNDVVKDSEIDLAAKAALEVKMLLYFYVRNEFHHFAMSVLNECIRVFRRI